jgi:hypothetical protein
MRMHVVIDILGLLVERDAAQIDVLSRWLFPAASDNRLIAASDH